jgi:DNA polymerase-4
VEQRDFPELRGRPVAVTNGLLGSCIITCSYEARVYGVKTGMRLKDAMQQCPGLIQRASRPEVYAAVSTAIMQALLAVTPDLEVFSVDEAVLDVTRCQRLHGTPPRMGWMAKRIVYDTSGLTCSVGVSGDKTTAKYASDLDKPDGLVVIPPWEARERLAEVPVTELCGIGEGVGAFLAEHGVFVCREMEKLPMSVLARRWGNIGRRIWLMCWGEDPEPVHTRVPAPKSLGHGKVVPPGTRDREVLLTYLQHMAEKVTARLRQHHLEAQRFFIGLRTPAGWIGAKPRLSVPGQDGAALFRLCRFVLEQGWHGEEVLQVQVTALDPRPCQYQGDLFERPDEAREHLHRVVDAINARFGEITIGPGRLVNRSPTPNVISPAWKPQGPRQTI